MVSSCVGGWTSLLCCWDQDADILVREIDNTMSNKPQLICRQPERPVQKRHFQLKPDGQDNASGGNPRRRNLPLIKHAEKGKGLKGEVDDLAAVDGSQWRQSTLLEQCARKRQEGTREEPGRREAVEKAIAPANHAVVPNWLLGVAGEGAKRSKKEGTGWWRLQVFKLCWSFALLIFCYLLLLCASLPLLLILLLLFLLAFASDTCR